MKKTLTIFSAIVLILISMLFITSCANKEQEDTDVAYSYIKNKITHFVIPGTLEIVDGKYRFFYDHDYIYFFNDIEITLEDGTTTSLYNLDNNTKIWIDTDDNVVEGEYNYFNKIYKITLR